jgi:hypothetical protein
MHLRASGQRRAGGRGTAPYALDRGPAKAAGSSWGRRESDEPRASQVMMRRCSDLDPGRMQRMTEFDMSLVQRGARTSRPTVAPSEFPALSARLPCDASGISGGR